MFYISSKVDSDKYGVTDTQDNVEEFYSCSELRHLYNKNIKIEGSYIAGYGFLLTPVVVNVARTFRMCGCKGDKLVFDYGYTVSKKPTLSTGAVQNMNFKSYFVFESKKELSRSAVVKFKLDSSIIVEGLEPYLSQSISKGDDVIVCRLNKSWFMVSNKIAKVDTRRYVSNAFIYDTPDDYFVQFDSTDAMLRFVKSNNLRILNDFYTKDSDSFWGIRGRDRVDGFRDELVVDRFVYTNGAYVGLFYDIVCGVLRDLERLICRKTGIETCYGEAGCGYFNPKGNCFHFTSLYDRSLLSFEVGVVTDNTNLSYESKATDLLSDYDYKLDLDQRGFCLLRAKLHPKKQYASDIRFYAK